MNKWVIKPPRNLENSSVGVSSFCKGLRDEEEKKAKTIYVKGFEKTNSTLDDLTGFFNKYENVIHINRRTYSDPKDNSCQFKGSVFVLFKDKASAEAFMALESVKNPEEEELIRKWQADYFEEKQKELEEKRAKTKILQKKALKTLLKMILRRIIQRKVLNNLLTNKTVKRSS